MFAGQTIFVERNGEFAELIIDAVDKSVNTLSKAALQELDDALKTVAASDVKGLLIYSKKKDFVVGADITEFIPMFARGEEALVANLLRTHAIFNQLEDMAIPSVVAISGNCLGGGFELALAGDFRLATEDARIGLPETKLGIFPGFGGTVRLSRLLGPDNALEWIATGKDQRAKRALKDGAIDGIVEKDKLLDAGRALLADVVSEKLSVAGRRAQKTGPLKLAEMEQLMAFQTARAVIAQQAGKNYPAPLAALSAVQDHANLPRDAAVRVEAKYFAKVARGPVAKGLISLFLADQHLKKVAKGWSQDVADVERMAVLGAGIMGGGIAGQAAKSGMLALMKDVAPQGIEQGLAEVSGVLGRRVARGRMKQEDMVAALNRLWPTMSYGDFDKVDVVVEAIVENPDIKAKVLAETEQQVRPDAIIASNTSTIPITLLAQSLQRPENFAGLHFFNPVHRMPLVEVIRGKQTSDETVAKLVKVALQMGKQPVVVNDCPGFFVNRVLFPYFFGFLSLIEQGVDYARIDKVMKTFGWPMGPAELLDVVGLDTAVHARAVMAKGFPDRMAIAGEGPLEALVTEGRLGQKSGSGFYQFVPDKKGRAQPQVDNEIVERFAKADVAMSDEQIVMRMMIPMAFETIRCLDEGIVQSASEADMALIYGLGFPPFKGGLLHWLDQVGMATVLSASEAWQTLSPLYAPPEGATANRKFFA
ncbi:fatty acid oxidation complex subunit alpha FadB [Salinibius halmophilus]|uniref:fatty acid oxidation complex subunit alpha FadB n=1 Tax=Salinibius halmophilus TaxID=1853216 RepID=UPI001F4266B6|nr:fatty acid oxidation complex subunit alpha FadB [Salinibius halmophilus]